MTASLPPPLCHSEPFSVILSTFSVILSAFSVILSEAKNLI